MQWIKIKADVTYLRTQASLVCFRVCCLLCLLSTLSAHVNRFNHLTDVEGIVDWEPASFDMGNPGRFQITCLLPIMKIQRLPDTSSIFSKIYEIYYIIVYPFVQSNFFYI